VLNPKPKVETFLHAEGVQEDDEC